MRKNSLYFLASLSLMVLGWAWAVSPTQAETCATKAVSSATFIKTHHLLDLTDGFGVSATKDGGYLLTGDTIPGSGMAPPFPFIIKTDAKGNLVWSKWFSSQSLALGQMSLRRIGRLTTTTTDGNLVMANDVLDFVDENTRELYGDILLTKINPKGVLLWSVMLGDNSEDRPQKLWALPDGGVLILGRFFQTGYGQEVADSEAVAKYGVFIKVDKNGKVVFSKKMAWAAEDMEPLPDGGFIALANLEVPKVEQPEHILGPELTPHALPTIIRLDKKFNILWAKSLEMIPSEFNSIASISGSNFTMGKTKIRLQAGDFRAVEASPDGGFLAFAFGDLSLSSGLLTGVNPALTSFSPRALLAVKVDADGNLEWSKKLTTNLTSALGSNDFQVGKTVDNYFVIMQDVVHDSATVQSANFSLSQLTATAANIALIKIDPDFNPVWAKQISAERDLSGYALQATADKGVVIAASMLTTRQHWVLTGLEPYKEATLIKLDANGVVAGCGATSETGEATVADQSSYVVSQTMDGGTVVDFKLKIKKKVKAKLSVLKDTPRDICKYQKNNVLPLCVATPTTATGQTTTPVAKTWATINYDNTKEVVAEGAKNQTIHAELLPILQQIYGQQVKLKDSMKSMWLTYVFPRPATRADVEAVEKYYVGLGYKVDDSTGGQLNVSKVGLTLHLTFAIQNSMAGKLEVLF
ncbi:MAG: hypothetical protein PHW95_05595 [Patescibacteria group bacterium]|nr:hypothetical protein [Patescibacteria group bacterium]